MAMLAAAKKAGVLGGLAVASGLGTVGYCEPDSKYFDPEALERGAKALREINQSPYAKKVGLGMLGRVGMASRSGTHLASH